MPDTYERMRRAVEAVQYGPHVRPFVMIGPLIEKWAAEIEALTAERAFLLRENTEARWYLTGKGEIGAAMTGASDRPATELGQAAMRQNVEIDGLKARLGVVERHVRALRAHLDRFADPEEGWPDVQIANDFESSRDDVPDVDGGVPLADLPERADE